MVKCVGRAIIRDRAQKFWGPTLPYYSADNLAFNLAYNHMIVSVIIAIIIRDNNRSIQLALARNENLWIAKLTKSVEVSGRYP